MMEELFFPYPANIASRIEVQKKAIAKMVVALVSRSAVPLADIKLLPPPMPNPPPSLLCIRTKPTIEMEIMI